MHVQISPFCARMLFSTLAIGCLLTMRPGFADTLIRTGGTGSAVRAISDLGAAFKHTRPGTDIVVLQGLGSGGAVKALAAHALDLGLTARPLKPAERSQPLQEVEVARSPLVFAGVKTDPGLTLAKVADIYAGKQQAWPDGSTLRLILRPEGDSETAVLRAVSPVMDHAIASALARPGMHVALADDEAVTALQSVPGAFGPTTLAMLIPESRPIHALALDGVTPSVATLSNGRYRLSKPLYLVVRADAPEPVHALVSFIRSPRGAKILASHGYQPISTAGRY